MPVSFKQATNGQFYFVITASNGQVLAASELYTQKHNARKGFNALVDAIHEMYGEELPARVQESEEETTVEGWLFWEQINENAFEPLAFTDDEKWIAQQRALLNQANMPPSMVGRTVIMDSQVVNDFVGHRPPTRPR